MPTSLPSRSTSAPPELPGLIAASVWMKERKSPAPIERASAETMPLVTVWPTPNGLPIASTRSPTSSASLSPSVERRQLLAMRVDLQHGEIGMLVDSITLASNSRRSLSTTWISSAWLMT